MGIEKLLNEILVAVEVNRDDAIIMFTTASGKKYKMYHQQNCCESVFIKDIAGDIEDLLHSPITLAEETWSNQNESENTPNRRFQFSGSETWTFYKLATVKGYVTISWHGSSNGYYSESVYFEDLSCYGEDD